MYIDVIPNRNSPPAVLLRETHRDGKKSVKTTLANLSALPPEAIAALRVILSGGRDGAHQIGSTCVHLNGST